MFSSLYQWVVHALQTSDFAKGGMLVMVVGGIIAYFRKVPGQLRSFFCKHYLATMVMDEEDMVMTAFSDWVIHTSRPTSLGSITVKAIWQDSDLNYQISPHSTSVWIWRKWKPVHVRFIRDDMKIEGSLIIGSRKRMVATTIWRDKSVLTKMVDEAIAYRQSKQPRKTTASWQWIYGSWQCQSMVEPRPPETIVMANGVWDDIVADAKWFFESEKWYIEKGIPYRRGYLFDGPPGNGKTSLTSAIAAHFNMSLASISLRDFKADVDLRNALMMLPQHALLLIEDIDACWDKHRTTQEKTEISFSGLLNALDGVAAGTGRLLVMTTNHPDRLDPALIRPGRADRRFTIKNPDLNQVIRMVTKFFPDAPLSLREEYAVRATKNGHSMAQVQSDCMSHLKDVNGLITASKSWPIGDIGSTSRRSTTASSGNHAASLPSL